LAYCQRCIRKLLAAWKMTRFYDRQKSRSPRRANQILRPRGRMGLSACFRPSIPDINSKYRASRMPLVRAIAPDPCRRAPFRSFLRLRGWLIAVPSCSSDATHARRFGKPHWLSQVAELSSGEVRLNRFAGNNGALQRNKREVNRFAAVRGCGQPRQHLLSEGSIRERGESSPAQGP
jgi:hypothetical protein